MRRWDSFLGGTLLAIACGGIAFWVMHSPVNASGGIGDIVPLVIHAFLVGLSVALLRGGDK